MAKEELYVKAIEKWGIEAQIMMVFEEMAELQKELCKALRRETVKGNYVNENIVEEIADVEIMLEQMKQYFGCTPHVERYKENKLARLERRVSEDG